MFSSMCDTAADCTPVAAAARSRADEPSRESLSPRVESAADGGDDEKFRPTLKNEFMHDGALNLRGNPKNLRAEVTGRFDAPFFNPVWELSLIEQRCMSSTSVFLTSFVVSQLDIDCHRRSL
mmetsp:Transcript_8737/g.21321  ORF Transcript_8737/g.21321 Transcript_8737/m.21321 type:complete len:122 (-) Transcript_8737:58-423(-)